MRREAGGVAGHENAEDHPGDPADPGDVLVEPGLRGVFVRNFSRCDFLGCLPGGLLHAPAHALAGLQHPGPAGAGREGGVRGAGLDAVALLAAARVPGPGSGAPVDK